VDRAGLRRRRASVLLLTPALTGGSWVSTERLLEMLPEELDLRVVGLGRRPIRRIRQPLTVIPYPRFDKHGALTVGRPLAALVWHLPLLVAALAWVSVHRGALVLCNGLAAALPLAPLLRRLGCRTVVLFHGHLDEGSALGPAIVRASRSVDLVVANSSGSEENLLTLFPRERVVVQRHAAGAAFFSVPLERADPSAPTTVLYVGRLDPDKVVEPLIEALESHADLDLRVLFAGVGALQGRVERLAKDDDRVEYHGYVASVRGLLGLYGRADAVWSYGDDTYLALPAVEALAAGRPVVVPERVAVAPKAQAGHRVAAELVPPDVGWLIDTDDDVVVVEMLTSLAGEGVSASRRSAARAHAEAHYAPREETAVVERIVGLAS